MALERIKLACIGAGYVGATLSCVLAYKCPNVDVFVLDSNEQKIKAWNSLNAPIYEEGLNEILNAVSGQIKFTTDSRCLAHVSLIFIAVNTSIHEYGSLANLTYDMSAYDEVARMIAKNVTNNAIIVEKSTVPVRAADYLRMMLDINKRDNVNFEVISNPEFLSEGTAIRDMLAPDRVLIGGLDTPNGHTAVNYLAGIYNQWVPKDKIITTGLYTAELSKLAANAMLAQRVASINTFAEICESVGANVSDLARAIGSDQRIGSKYLKSSPGFGGPCLTKDLHALVYMCRERHLDMAANFWEATLLANDYHRQRAGLILRSLFINSLRNKHILVLGLAFKKDTDDYRNSPAIDLVDFLLNEGASVHIYDPKVSEINLLHINQHIYYVHNSPYTGAVDADVIVIMTEWDEFRAINWAQMRSFMRTPAYLLDMRDVVNINDAVAAGFIMQKIGQ